MTEFLRRIRNAWLCLAHGHYALARPDHSKYQVTSAWISPAASYSNTGAFCSACGASPPGHMSGCPNSPLTIYRNRRQTTQPTVFR